LISLTSLAREKVRDALIKRHKGIGIRIGVKTTGCSGLAYTLEYLDEDKFDPLEERIIFSEFIVKIYTRDLVYIRGTVMDWKKNGLNEGFDFINPNEKDRCGCGESFRI
jgi:iron-sulfur cluster assembly protein